MARRGPRRFGVDDCRGISSAGLRVLGVMLIVVGLLVASLAFAHDGFGEGIIVIFPFVFGNVGGWAAVVFTVVFFALFILSSLLPWYLVSRRRGIDDGFVAFKRGRLRRTDSETMEYIITTELPRRLRNRVYIEADEEEIHLRSTEDEAFHRRYTLPMGFEVDEIDYDYEGGYLVLKLLLKRSI